MRNAEITAFFNVMGILTAPGYIDEMVNQGFQPGDVQFFASDFNSQASELVSGQIANSPTSGDLYNEAIIIDFETPACTAPRATSRKLCRRCALRSTTRTTRSAPFIRGTTLGDSSYGMSVSVCNIVRTAARGIYDAGDNPTRDDIVTAMNALGPVDFTR